MGVVNHNAIIATTWSDKHAASFQEWVNELSELTQLLILRGESWANGYHTFVVLPDGSQEGWPESDSGDSLRNAVADRLKQDNYHEEEDDSSPWDWIEVGFGEFGQKVLRGNCKNCYSDAEYAG